MKRNRLLEYLIMNIDPQNGLQISVSAENSPFEEEIWRELCDFHIQENRLVAWRARGTRAQVDFIESSIETWLGLPENHWYLPGYWETRVHPDDRDDFAAFNRNVGHETGFHRRRYRLLDRGGKPVWVEESSCARRSDSGDLLICGFFADVTREQQLAEEVLQISNFERERLGQDLHDDFCQNLAGIACLSTMLEKQLAKDSPKNAAAAADITKQLNEALARVRSLSHSLAPLQLEDTDLVHCLHKLIQDTETRCGVTCHPDLDTTVVIDSAETRTHLYRLCQEAIRNAICHGNASQITITLSRSKDSRCYFRIEDNGRGFPDRPASSDGLGIRLMKHRCRQFSGELHLRNGNGGGAVVECIFANP